VEITSLAFMEPHALLASADVSGNVAIWDVSAPSGYSHKSVVEQVLTRFINMQSLERSPAVTCFGPDCEEPSQLYTGDEDGNVRKWDLSQLLTEANILPCEPKASWDPHKRAPAYDAGQTAGAMARKTVALETPELSFRISGQIVKQALNWKAHTDNVRSLGICKKPACIVTAGHDHMVKIWTREGGLMTVVRAHSQTAWHFPVQADEITIDGNLIDRLQAAMQRQFCDEGNRQKSSKHLNTIRSLSVENKVNVERQRDRIKDLDQKRQVMSTKIAQKAKLGLHLQSGTPREKV
jgi:WD40 repeat protein